MAEFNTVDVKNAARLLRDYCESQGDCERCVFLGANLVERKIAAELDDFMSPSDWDIDKEATHD